MNKQKITKFSFVIIFLIVVGKGYSQQVDTAKVDLFAEIDKEAKINEANETNYTYATFKSNRVINGHSIEILAKNHLEFRIAHRFGTLNSGFYDLFGLDNATMRMGLDYGLCNNLMIGIGRSTVNKEFDGYAKYKFLKQSTGKNKMPISAAFFTGIYQTTEKTSEKLSGSQRLAFVNQLLIARKFSENFSFQLSPTLVHLNMVNLAKEKNTMLSLGFGGRYKVSKRVALCAEYFHQFDKLDGKENSLSLGVDIETGGHVFQLHFTNSTGLTERSFVTNTTGRWGNGDIHFGFNLIRVFSLAKKKDSKNW
jgi:hypothetical protein